MHSDGMPRIAPAGGHEVPLVGLNLGEQPPTEDRIKAVNVRETIENLRSGLASIHLGGDVLIERTLICAIAGGHLLIEDRPGTGKTLLARGLTRLLGGKFSRIQGTPDLLPADLIGAAVPGADGLHFEPGPVFADCLLFDEINRATPRTQSALLEAMAEGAVTVDGTRHALPEMFFVVATQNPQEEEGTFPLPESQLDRFLMLVTPGYPSAEDEQRILRERPNDRTLPTLAEVMSPQDMLTLRQQADGIHLAEDAERWIVAFAQATRLHDQLQLGLSPRGSLAIATVARTQALLAGRDHVRPEDVRQHLIPTVAHRLRTRNGTAIEPIVDSIAEDIAWAV